MKALQGRKGLPARKVHKESRGFRVRWGRRASPAQQGNEARRVSGVYRENGVYRESPALLAHAGSRGHRGSLVRGVKRASKGTGVYAVSKDYREYKALRGLKAHPDKALSHTPSSTPCVT